MPRRGDTCKMLFVKKLNYSLFIPFHHFSNPFFNLNPVMPAQGMKLCHIGEFSQRAIWLAGIEKQRSAEPDDLFYQFCQLTNTDFPAGADIDVGVTDK